VSKSVKLGLYAVPENYEKQICFSISENNLTNSQKILSEHIDEISDILEDVGFSDTPPQFYTRFDTSVKNSFALEMIKNYDFDVTIIETNNNVGKIPDKLYYFDCPFEYENEHMMLRIMFESHFWENMPVFVNVTRNDFGVPTLTNSDITVFVGGINSTVLFQNNLDEEITLRSIDSVDYQRNENDRYYDQKKPERLSENKFAKITNEDKIIIPSGKAFSYHFSNWSNPHSTPLNYTITPSNLKGSITVIPYYDCDPSQDIFLAYSKIHKIPEAPTYLPDEYKYECGFYHYPEAATYYYANSTLSEKFGGVLGHGINPEFLSAGGLAIRFVDVKSYGMPYMEPESDKFTKLAEQFSSESMVTYLNGQPTILEKTNYGDMFNRITIFVEYNTWYIIEGGISLSELYRIAESIPFEKGDKLIPETFDNPFKNKSLIIELIDMQEIYQPEQPISFEVFTLGHIPVASHLVVMIHDFEGNTVWQNTPSVDIGDSEIGYVDYTWSTQYDLEVPQIHEPGIYEIMISWSDVTLQQKFQIRDETQFSLLRDVVPEFVPQEDLLTVFDNDCFRKEIDQISVTKNTKQDIQNIQDKLKENDQLLNLIFEKQEVMTNNENRTFSYEVPHQVIQCIENIKSDQMNLVGNLKQYDQNQEFDIQLLLRESEIFYHGHEYLQAIKTVDLILENSDTNNSDALIVKGKSLVRLGHNEDAIKIFEKTIQNNPDFANGWYNLGRVLSSNDQHEKAIQQFDQAIRIDPKFGDTYIDKAFTLLILERYEEALQSADNALQVNPDRRIYQAIYQTIFDVLESQRR